ncbi:Uu.00g012000.m01.CDS01 [Anthostomella pinea]|uniref:Uu.00g012000.m01.CDS01 n=1 Tax=Anthostomella pinea TaxID=933095 RepID=A0AAI8VXV2_9PEZI|nr:Uu.00g012000.m01.CDS01 [Anthostomella pinea]
MAAVKQRINLPKYYIGELRPLFVRRIYVLTRLHSDNQNLSSTFEITSEPFDFEKHGTRDYWYARGKMFRDNVKLGDSAITNFSMAVAYNVSNFIVPALGLAWDLSQSDSESHNLVLHMFSQGLIPTPAYSIWLDKQENPAGEVLFGAIDKAKYEGDLTSLKTYPSSDGDALISIMMTSLSATSPSGSDKLICNLPFPIILGMGATASFLPQDLAYEESELV